MRENLKNEQSVRRKKRTWLVITLILMILALVTRFYITSHLDNLVIDRVAIDGEVKVLMEHNESLLVGSRLYEVTAFDEDMQQIWTFATEGEIVDIAGNGDDIYVASTDRNVYKVNASDGELKTVIDATYPPKAISVGDDGHLYASASMGALKNRLFIFDSDGTQLAKKDFGSVEVSDIQTFGDEILVACGDGYIRILDENGETLKERRFDYAPIGIRVLGEGERIVFITKEGLLGYVDSELNSILELTLAKDNNADFISISKNASEDKVAVGTSFGELYIYDADGRMLYSEFHGEQRPVWDTGFTQNGERLYISRSQEGFDIINNEAINNIQTYKLFLVIVNVLVILLTIAVVFLLLLSFDRSRHYVTDLAKRVWKVRVAYLMLLPALVLLIIFNYFTLSQGFVRAFTDWSANYTKIRFIGLENFRLMFEEGYFFIGVKNLMILLLTSYVKILTVPLIVAVLIFNLRNDRHKFIYRILFMIPMVVPGIVNALLWKNGIYNVEYGAINSFLRAIDAGHLQQNWIGDERFAIWAVVFAGFPFVSIFHMLVYYGGLINIPGAIFEAAKIDGCSRLNSFFRISLPLISSQIKLLLILGFIGVVQDFASVYFLTGGGPGVSTYVPGLELFYNATQFGRYGYASALAVFMFIFILLATLLQMRVKAKESI